MSEYRGFVFDIDKTAIPNGAQSVESKALKDVFARMSGAVIAIAATGRSPEYALPITRELELKHESVVANGALIIDSLSGDIRWERLLSEAQMARIIQICRSYENSFWMTGDEHGDSRSARHKQPRSVPAAFLLNVSGEIAPTIQAELTGLAQVRAYLSPSWSGQENNFDVNIGHIDASKATALAALYEKYSLDPSEMIGVGDGINDAELFEAVGHRVAVANADPRLIELADEVVASQEEDGLVDVVKRFHPSK